MCHLINQYSNKCIHILIYLNISIDNVHREFVKNTYIILNIKNYLMRIFKYELKL